jgi:hypothetical protein
MAGKHSKRRAHAQTISVQRRPGIELVDACRRVAHRVTSDELLAGRRSGDYEALCGARLLSASLTDPTDGTWSVCGVRAVSDTTSGWSPVERPPSKAPGGRSCVTRC